MLINQLLIIYVGTTLFEPISSSCFSHTLLDRAVVVMMPVVYRNSMTLPRFVSMQQDVWLSKNSH